MADNFFQGEEKMDDQQEEIQKIKVGEKEYDPNELNRLVGLGEIAVEAEEKYNRPISKFWPEYTKSQQELEKLRAELETTRQASQPKVEPTDQELTAQQAKEELKKLGYLPADEVGKMVQDQVWNAISGVKMVDKIESLVSRNTQEGNPATTVEDLAAFMKQTNINDPEIAYKIKFEKELDQIKERKLASLKPQGLYSESTSTAGSKQPQPVKVTKDNLSDVLSGYLRGNN